MRVSDWGSFLVRVLGKARYFESASQAVQTYYEEDPKSIDQYLPAFVVAKHGEPIGKIHDKDSVVFFNFRGEVSKINLYAYAVR